MLYAISGILIAGLLMTFAVLQLRKKFQLSTKKHRWAHDVIIVATTPIPLLLMIVVLRNDQLLSASEGLTGAFYLASGFVVTIVIATVVGLVFGLIAHSLPSIAIFKKD